MAVAWLAMEAVRYIAMGAIAFGGVVPFVPQYFKIVREQSCAGFSTYVVMTLLAAYIIRVGFW